MIKEYTIPETYRIFGKSVSKGAQQKYYYDGYYYKVDTTVKESFNETLVTLVLSYSTINIDRYVSYELCKINGKPGCRSKSFLSHNEEFVTIGTAYERLTGKDNLSDTLMCMSTARERLEFLYNIASGIGVSKDDFYDYLETMLQVDLLIHNYDRHIHNYGFIWNIDTGQIRLAPIFDNGRSFSPHEPSCTLSGSYEDQVVAFGFPVNNKFSINIQPLISKLSELPNNNSIKFLRDNLIKYEYLFASSNFRKTNFFGKVQV